MPLHVEQQNEHFVSCKRTFIDIDGGSYHCTAVATSFLEMAPEIYTFLLLCLCSHLDVELLISVDFPTNLEFHTIIESGT